MLPFGRIWYIYNLHYEKFADGSVKCIEDEIPFELPEGWAWCRLSQIITLYSGQDLEPSRYNDEGIGIPYITGASNLENGKVIINRWTDSPTTRATIGDLLITCKGSGVGKMAWCSICDAHIARQIMALRCIDGLYSDYLEVVISAMLTNIKSKANGLIPGLSRDIILGIMFPLPPFEEQKLICIKCREVLSYIDNIDNQKTDLVETIDIIKSRILDLAIRGKLVPQNPDDEPASVLLERIRAEKEELIRQGKIKRDKKESVIFKGEDNSYYVSADGIKQKIEDYMQYSLPEGWVWICLKDVATISSGKTPTSELLSEDGKIPYYKISDMNVEGNELFLDKTTNYLNDEYDGVVFNKGSFVFPKNGGAVLTNKKRILLHNSLVDLNTGVITFSPFIDAEYAFLMFSFIDFSKLYKGSTIPTVDANVISNLIFALPPLNEQQHIVQVVKKTFAQLDAIADSLN